MGNSWLRRFTRFGVIVSFALAWISAILLGSIQPGVSQPAFEPAEIAAILSLTGDGASSGQPVLEGIELALEEYNAGNSDPRVRLTTYDDESSLDRAKQLTQEIVDSPAILTLGPSFSTTSLAIGPTFDDAGLVSLPPTATSDAITDNATTFRMVFKNSDQGGLLATYISRILEAQQATVIVENGTYGETLRQGFERAAQQLNLEATYYPFGAETDLAALTRQSVDEANGEHPIVPLTLDPGGAQLLTQLGRQRVTGPFLGGDALGDASFAQLLTEITPGSSDPEPLTRNLYGLAPVILDSANADVLAFADRFLDRYGHNPVWLSVAGYDAANLAVKAVQSTLSHHSAGEDTSILRSAIFSYLYSLNRVDKALPGLLGPFWFDQSRARQQGIRVGRFDGPRLESAPVQIVPVMNPDPAELDAGVVFPLGPDRYARLQRVVYTGVFLNEVSTVNIASSTFNADFYLWLKFAPTEGTGDLDPTDLIFPSAVEVSFDPTQPSKKRRLDDGTEYRLWRVRGEFRNDYNLRMFPFDQQTLLLSFFNARADLQRIVYVLDELRSAEFPGDLSVNGAISAVTAPGDATNASLEALANPSTANPEGWSTLAAPRAFRNLTQWLPLGTQSRRENLVTPSALGDPTLAAVQSQRELSGFVATVDLQRRTLATLTKSLLPLLLMTFIMYASLHFPVALVKEKVSVAITGALSGAVLLTAINNQLGQIGYTIAVEYVFYIFFGLSLLCIVGVLTSERLRSRHLKDEAARVDRWVKILYLTTVALTLLGTVVLYLQR